MSRLLLPFTAGAIGFALLAAAGCDEVNARRLIQEGDSLYEDAEYAEAVEKYERALSKVPDLEIGHHNAGLAYLERFRPGDEDTYEYAGKAAEHFQRYLEVHPDDATIRGLLTRTWVEAEHYDRAREYWMGELEEQPDNLRILERLAAIERQAGEYEEAIEWHLERAGRADTEEAEVEVFVDIAQLQLSRLRDESVVGAERAQVADYAIAALQDALEINPEHETALNYMSSVYQLRALAHGASWANKIDQATFRLHHRAWQEVAEEGLAAEDEDGADGDGDEAAESGDDSDS